MKRRMGGAASRKRMIPQHIIDFLKEREGFKTIVYLDTLDKPTAGLGHLLHATERVIYKVGDTVPESLLETWAQQDVALAYASAGDQAAQIGVTDEAFVVVLTSVNFQLGTKWNEKFPSTWHYMLKHKWEDAAREAGLSRWANETPVRCNDFQAALRALIPVEINNGHCV